MRRAAVEFVGAWLVYATAECFFASILPWLLTPQQVYTPLHWGFTALLFLIYPAIGVVLGVLVGLAVGVLAPRLAGREADDSRVYAVLATASIVIAFAVNLALPIRDIGLFELPPLAVSMLLAVALTMSLASSRWFERLAFLIHPITVSLLLLGMPSVTTALVASGAVTKALANLTYALVIGAASYGLYRGVHGLRTGRLQAPAKPAAWRPLASLGLLAGVVLGAAFFVDHAPLRDGAAATATAGNTATPNVILITLDTVRADHLSVYGYERDTTPNLKTLAKRATLYTRAVASSDMTLATHASIFTGLYARQHGAHYEMPRYPEGRPLSASASTLTEILAANGYFTMAIVANHGYLGSAFGFRQGFRYYDQRAPVPFLGVAPPFFLRQAVRDFFTRFDSPYSYGRINRRADEINREVFPLLGEVSKDGRRFFLFVNYMDPHWPYTPPPPFDRLYPGKGDPLPWEEFLALKREVMSLQRPLEEDKRNNMISQYDGEIAYLDQQVGHLLAKIEALDLYDNSLIVITSDHGEAFGKRNLIGHGVSVYQNQVHVPLIIKYPNDDKGRIVDEVVSVVDLKPTVLDVLGLEVPGGLPGQSLAKADLGPSRTVVSESFPDRFLWELHPRFRRVERAVFRGPYKLIRSTSGVVDLQDLSLDPAEEGAPSTRDAAASRELEAHLVRWLDETPEFREPVRRGKPKGLSESEKERMRALGYMH